MNQNDDFEMIFVGVEKIGGISWVLFRVCEFEAIAEKILEARREHGKSAAVLMIHHYPGGGMPAAEYSAEGLRWFIFECVLSNAGG